MAIVDKQVKVKGSDTDGIFFEYQGMITHKTFGEILEKVNGPTDDWDLIFGNICTNLGQSGFLTEDALKDVVKVKDAVEKRFYKGKI